MIAAYVSGHGFGHATRLCEVLRHVRARAPSVPISLVGAVPGWLVRRGIGADVALRNADVDVGLAQRDALTIDEAATAERCRAFDAGWDARVAEEAAFLRGHEVRVVVGDIPPLAFAAAARAGLHSFALGNFSWDWIYRHLAPRQPSLAASADLAARAYATAGLLLELPFAGDLSAFPRRERVGLVARRPRVDRAEARRRLGLDARPAVLVSFGGIGLPDLSPGTLRGGAGAFQWLHPEGVAAERLDPLGLAYPDVVGAVDVVLTKPGYGIVSDAIAARTRVVYTDRGDFPEYPILVAEMPRYVACAYVPRAQLRTGELTVAIRDVLARPMPDAPDLGGAARAAELVVGAL